MAYESDLDDPSKLTNAKIRLDEIVYGLMSDIELVYNHECANLFHTKNLSAVIGDGVTLGLSAGGAIATHIATKTILAALNTAVFGVDLPISEQSFQVKRDCNANEAK